MNKSGSNPRNIFLKFILIKGIEIASIPLTIFLKRIFDNVYMKLYGFIEIFFIAVIKL